MLEQDDGEEWGLMTVEPRQEGCGWRTCEEPLNRLHDELVLLSETCAPSHADAAIVERIRTQVERASQALVADVEAHLFGSQAVGLATSASDMDLVLLSATRFLLLPDDASEVARDSAKHEKIDFMHHLVARLTPEPFVTARIIAHATVPVIKACTHGGMQCDISVGTDGAVLSVKVMKEQIQRFPELRPLVVFTKRLLSQHGLNEVFSGGLSSYAIFHLALSFLRTRSGRDSHGACPQGCPQFPFFINGEEGARSEKQRGLQFPADELCQVAVGGLGLLLVDMLDLYGGQRGAHGYDMAKHAICCRRGVVDRVSTRLMNAPALRSGRRHGDAAHKRICIVDMLDNTHDVSKGCFRSGEVTAAMRNAASTLKRACMLQDRCFKQEPILRSVLRHCPELARCSAAYVHMAGDKGLCEHRNGARRGSKLFWDRGNGQGQQRKRKRLAFAESDEEGQGGGGSEGANTSKVARDRSRMSLSWSSTPTVRGHSKDNPECTCKHDAGVFRNNYQRNPECPVEGDGAGAARASRVIVHDNIWAGDTDKDFGHNLGWGD